MELTSIAMQNILSPVTLFFLLGFVAGRLKSDLSIPETVSRGLSLYLMIAIGFRGGVELSHGGSGAAILAASGMAVAMSFSLPIMAYALLRWSTRLDSTNAAAVAAHYGSVSVVTFVAAIAVLRQQGEPFEAYLVAMLALMEAPAIITGVFLARRNGTVRENGNAAGRPITPALLHEVLLSGTVFLLLGSLAIGWITGDKGAREIGPLFDRPFQGVLCLFLLDMGLVAARRLSDLYPVGWRVAVFGLYMPPIGAAVGIGAAWLLGLSVGGTTLLAVLGASASYIVVPAAMRIALPKASPAISLTLAIGITFPFNLVVGIPLYHSAALALAPFRIERSALIERLAPPQAASDVQKPNYSQQGENR